MDVIKVKIHLKNIHYIKNAIHDGKFIVKMETI